MFYSYVPVYEPQYVIVSPRPYIRQREAYPYGYQSYAPVNCRRAYYPREQYPVYAPEEYVYTINQRFPRKRACQQACYPKKRVVANEQEVAEALTDAIEQVLSKFGFKIEQNQGETQAPATENQTTETPKSQDKGKEKLEEPVTESPKESDDFDHVVQNVASLLEIAGVQQPLRNILLSSYKARRPQTSDVKLPEPKVAETKPKSNPVRIPINEVKPEVKPASYEAESMIEKLRRNSASVIEAQEAPVVVETTKPATTDAEPSVHLPSEPSSSEVNETLVEPEVPSKETFQEDTAKTNDHRDDDVVSNASDKSGRSMIEILQSKAEILEDQNPSTEQVKDEEWTSL